LDGWRWIWINLAKYPKKKELNENDSDSGNHLFFYREKGYGLVKMLSVHPYIYMCVEEHSLITE
jgi:hypothetical protein